MSEFNFWKNVKDSLGYKNMQNKELAAKAEINLGTLNNQITRNITPNLETAYKIAKVLDVSLECLLTGKPTKSNDPALPYEDLTLLNDFHLLSKENKALLKAIISSMTKISTEITPDGENYVIVK